MKFNLNMSRNSVYICLGVLLGAIILACIIGDKNCYVASEPMENLNPNKPMFGLFYSATCPHCKSMMPEWDSLQSKYAGDPRVTVEKFEKTQAPDLMSKHNIRAYPTMIFFSRGMANENFEGNDVYDGERTAPAMSNYIEGVLAQLPDQAAPLDGSEPPARPQGFPIQALSQVSDIMGMN